MTEPERKVARALLDEARRREVASHSPPAPARKQDAAGRPLCAYCGSPFDSKSTLRIYCTPAHKKSAWLKTEPGRVYNRARKLRQRQNQRARAMGVAEPVAA